MLTPGEARQRIREYLDHESWCRNCLQIIDKRGMRVPLSLSPSQVAFNASVQAQERRLGYVRQVVVKGRQVHMTVGITADLFRRIVFMPGRQAIVVAHLDTTVNELRKYWRQMIESYEPWGPPGAGVRMPAIVKDNDDTIEWENASAVLFRTAGSMSIGRGARISAVHLTEFPYYPDPERTLLDITNALPPLRGTYGVIESTANGVGDPFHRLWQSAGRPAPEYGGGKWEQFFFSSFDHPENRIELTPTHQQAILDSLQTWEEDLRINLGLRPEQIAWMRHKIDESCGGSLAKFQQEHPWSAEVAFQASGRCRFDTLSLQRMPICEPILNGDIRTLDGPHGPTLMFVPRSDGRGTINLWKKPKPGRSHVIGADPSRGIDVSTSGNADPDWSAACALDAESGEQVATLADRSVPSVFAKQVADLARWLGRDTYVCPEANELGFIEALISEYPTHLITRRDRQPDAARDNRSAHHYGFLETARTRKQLIDQLDDAIRKGDVIVHDAATQAECYSFVVKADGRPEHADGTHDDRVFGLALAVEAMLKRPRGLLMGPESISDTGKPVGPLRRRPVPEDHFLRGY